MKQQWLILLALSVLTFSVSAQTLTFEFVSIDDPGWVADNPFVITGLSGRNVTWAFSPRTIDTHANWVPLTFLSLMLDAQIFGSGAGGFHLINVLLHCANTLLLYSTLYRMTREPGRCAVVAALFAVHPLHVESVAWVTERKDTLSVFFGLLAIWAYARYASRHSVKFYLASLAFYLLSLLAKQTLVTLPFLLLLLDFWPLRRWTNDRFVSTQGEGAHDALAPVGRCRPSRLLLEKAPYLVLSLMFCVLVFAAQSGARAVGDERPVSTRIAHAASAYVDYLEKAIWPVGLSVHYPLGERSDSFSDAVPAILLLSAISALAVVLRKRAPCLLTGWFWFLGTLVPMIGIVQVGTQRIADRYTYFPLTGLFLLAAWLPASLVRGRRLHSYLLPAVAAVTITVLSLMYWRQTTYWRDSLALFEHSLSVTADDGRVHQMLALELFQHGRVEESFAHFREGARLEPLNQSVHVQWGVCLHKAGRTEEAIDAVSRALEINPDNAEAHFALGFIHEEQGRFELAIRSYATGLTVDPHNAEVHYNLGTLLLRAGQLDGAAEHFQQALTINPEYARAHSNLGAVYLAQGRRDLAIERFEAAVQIDPSLIPARRALQEARSAVADESPP